MKHYAFRYLIALASWCAIVACDLFLRFGFVFMVPFVCLMKPSQQKAQTLASVADFLMHPLMRFPRADWRRLLSLRRRHSPSNRTLLN